MALKNSMTYCGLPVDYIVVIREQFAKEINKTRFSVAFYKNKEEREINVMNYVGQPLVYEMDGYKSMSHCYAYLKTLPMYEGAVDC